MSSLPHMKCFPCESSKAWLLLEGLNVTFSATLQAPIPLHHIASTGVGFHHACPDVPRALRGSVLQELPQKDLGITLGKFHSLPFGP